jgi:hypothetical protein
LVICLSTFISYICQYIEKSRLEQHLALHEINRLLPGVIASLDLAGRGNLVSGIGLPRFAPNDDSACQMPQFTAILPVVPIHDILRAFALPPTELVTEDAAIVRPSHLTILPP